MSLKAVGVFDCITVDPSGGWFGESQTGTPFIRIPLVVTSGDQKGATIVWYGYLTSAALDKTVKRLCEVFGWNGDLDALNDGKATFANKPCQIETESEDYQCKTRIKVKWLNAPGGLAKPMPKEKVTALLTKLRSASLAAALPEAATTTDTPPDFDESGVPF